LKIGLAEKNSTAHNSAQAQFGHPGKLIIFVFWVLKGKLKDFGHQSQTAPVRKTFWQV